MTQPSDLETLTDRARGLYDAQKETALAGVVALVRDVLVHLSEAEATEEAATEKLSKALCRAEAAEARVRELEHAANPAAPGGRDHWHRVAVAMTEERDAARALLADETARRREMGGRAEALEHDLRLIVECPDDVMSWVNSTDVGGKAFRAIRAQLAARVPASPVPNGTWRAGRSVGRTLYRDDVLVGLVDTGEIAAEIVARMNDAGEALTAKERSVVSAAKAWRAFYEHIDEGEFPIHPIEDKLRAAVDAVTAEKAPGSATEVKP